jgi:hypothetical protein
MHTEPGAVIPGVRNTRFDALAAEARRDALADMLATGAMDLDDLAAGWIGEDIQEEDERDDYEPEPDPAALLTLSGPAAGPFCHGQEMEAAGGGAWRCRRCGLTWPLAVADLDPELALLLAPTASSGYVCCGREMTWDGTRWVCGRCGGWYDPGVLAAVLPTPRAQEMPDEGDDACPLCGWWTCRCSSLRSAFVPATAVWRKCPMCPGGGGEEGGACGVCGHKL